MVGEESPSRLSPSFGSRHTPITGSHFHPKPSLPGINGDFTDAAVHVQVNRRLAFAGCATTPLTALLFQTVHFDLADPATRGSDDPSIRRQVDDRLTNAAVNAHGVVVLGLTSAQVEFNSSRSNMDLYIAQVQPAQIEPVLARAASQRKLRWEFIA